MRCHRDLSQCQCYGADPPQLKAWPSTLLWEWDNKSFFRFSVFIYDREVPQRVLT